MFVISDIKAGIYAHHMLGHPYLLPPPPCCDLCHVSVILISVFGAGNVLCSTVTLTHTQLFLKRFSQKSSGSHVACQLSKTNDQLPPRSDPSSNAVTPAL